MFYESIFGLILNKIKNWSITHTKLKLLLNKIISKKKSMSIYK